ncbi:hypothetical protein [Pseudomonas sp. UMAB-40]|uniref:hypothetical protein n=1 Tax=Pseudomonas sp. UMAB-40 TaxID=1365407 RepID=UPI001C5983BA|nr:hypothetical protein [Pseudomonas sp. UMAB-40]
MKKKSLVALALVACVAFPYQPVYAAPTDGACDIDEMMTSNRKKMDELARNEYENNLSKPMAKMIESAPTVKDASCLPILDTMDTLIRLRIPSLGALMGGLMAKIRDMACKYANDFIASTVGKLQYNISDPMGIASVGIGGTTDGTGGTQVERYDFSKVVSDQVQQVAKEKAMEYAREGVGNATKYLPNPASDRTPRVDSQIKNGLKDSLNGL